MMPGHVPTLLVGAKHETRQLGEAGEVRAGMRRGDERDAARPVRDRLPSLDAEARGVPEDLLGEDAAHAVRDEDDGAFADTFVGQRLENRGATIGERHRFTGPPQNAGRVAKRPAADVAKVLANPRRPEACAASVPAHVECEPPPSPCTKIT